MRLNPDDPRITAYILGELEETERADLEQTLESCAESRALVDEFRALSAELGELLGEDEDSSSEEEAPTLDPERRAALEAKLSQTEGAAKSDERAPISMGAARAKRRSKRGKWIFGGGIAVAASLLLVVAASLVMLRGMKDAPPPKQNVASAPMGAAPAHSRSRTLKNFASARSYDKKKSAHRYGLRTEPVARTGSSKRQALERKIRSRGVLGVLKSPAGSKDTSNSDLKDPFAKVSGVSVPATPKPDYKRVKEEEKSGEKLRERGEGRDQEDDTDKDGRDGLRRRMDIPRIVENPFRLAKSAPLSTFSIDVDTGAYSNVRNYLRRHTLPPGQSVRIEEMINYFDYRYAQPTDGRPFAVHIARSPAPWNPRHQLLRVALKGKEIKQDKRPSSNLVFLLDVSGSMGSPQKLPLLRRAMSKLVRRLGENDRVAIVVYAGASGLVLPSTACMAQNRNLILSSLERLNAGGSTNGGAGIQLAYRIAVKNYIRGGVNRVILATDGDFNVGPRSRKELVALIKRKAKSNVFLTVLGFGMSSYRDGTLEQLANKGNGSYAYIDSDAEAHKVLVKQLSGTLVTIAKDVKIQLEMNPAKIAAYRLIGYENRVMANKDFANDKKDAGEIGAGHTVTALYELVPVGAALPSGLAKSDKGKLKLRYAQPGKPTEAAQSELLTVKLRYKKPEGSKSTLMTLPVNAQSERLDKQEADFRFAASVAWFGMVLRGSRHLPAKARNLTPVLSLAREGLGSDRHGYRKEFLTLVKRARGLLK